MVKHAMNQWGDAEIEARLAAGPTGRDHLRAIDVHTHYLPPSYRRALEHAGITHPDGYHGGVPQWDTQRQIDHMARLGIEKAYPSLSTPGVRLPAGSAVDIARAANEEGAELARAHPEQFGFLASLPLPDVDASLREIERAFDELGAAGVALMTHTDGVYLGDQRLEPVIAELARREAVVLIHPTEPPVLVPDVMAGWSRSMYEFFFDSTRSVINLIFSGQLAKHPGIRLVIPHAGAALPALAQRLERNIWRANADGGMADGSPYPSAIQTLRNSWFDVAGSVLPHQLASLQTIADPTRIVYGSDFPYTSAPMGAELLADIRSTDLLDDDTKRALLADNARGLFSGAAERTSA